MRNRKNRDAGALSHFTQWFEHAADFTILVAVSFAEITRNRVDVDKSNIANFSNFPFEDLNILLQIESAPMSAVIDGRHDMNAFQISAGRKRTRNDSISRTILRIQDNDVSNRRAPLAAGPLAPRGHSGDDRNR